MMFASPAKFRSWTAIYNSIRLGQVMRARKRQQLESTTRELDPVGHSTEL